MGKILLLDNYDSFTYNLFHYLEELSKESIEVVRNDAIDLKQLDDYSALIISPGPGLPNEANQLMVVIDYFVKQKKKILGICLGQQALALHFGMQLSNLKEVVHGQSRTIERIDFSDPLFYGLPEKFKVGRYHSWVIEPKTLAEDIVISAADKQGHAMAIYHRRLPIHAVQFHPESVLTEYGKSMLENWLKIDL